MSGLVGHFEDMFFHDEAQFQATVVSFVSDEL